MATVGSALALVAQPPTPILAHPGVTSGPQAAVTPGQTTQQADSVTLAGQAAEAQQNSDNGNGSAQFGQASAFFFAEQESFRAGNGSGGNQSATATAPSLPVKTTDEANVGNAQGETVTSGQATPTASQGSVSNSTADTAATNGGESTTQTAGSASSGKGEVDTPIAELAQLDDTLQQMGIDPQSISLFSRMAMLLYANDPAALRVLVQTMQNGAQQLTAANSNAQNGGGATGAAGANASLQGLLPAQTQSTQSQGSQYEPATVPDNAQQTQVSVSDATTGAAGTANGATALNQSVSLPAYVLSATSDASASGTGQLSQPTAYATQLGRLNSTFAAVEGRLFSLQKGSAESGQLLNVSA